MGQANPQLQIFKDRMFVLRARVLGIVPVLVRLGGQPQRRPTINKQVNTQEMTLRKMADISPAGNAMGTEKNYVVPLLKNN